MTDEQIERYSRQIILPEVGGRGQERLLAANLTLLAEAEDLTPALNYLAGAGIGTMRLDCPASSGVDRLAAQAMALNPDVRVEVADHQVRAGETLLVLAGTDRVVEAARRLNLTAAKHPMIFARLAEPHLIAVLSGHPPCLECAHDALLAPVLQPGPFAAPIAMVAAAETIKNLLAVAPQPSRLIEFSGYESRSHELTATQRAGCRICG